MMPAPMTANFHPKRVAPWLALGVLLLAFALRVYRINDQNVWWDEGWTIWLAGQTPRDIALRTAVDAHPPLHYWLMHYWGQWAGTQALAGRLLSAFFGLGMVAVMYRVGRQAGGMRLGLLAALLLAAARFNVWWSQDIKNYTLAGCFGLAAAWLTLRLFQPGPAPGRRLWVGYAAASLLAVYSHYLAWLLFLANNLFAAVCLLAAWRRQGWPGRQLARWSLAQLAVLAAFAPWLALHLNRATLWEPAPPLDPGFFLQLAATLFTLGVTHNIEAHTLAVAALLLLAAGGAAWALAGRGLTNRFGQAALLGVILVSVPPVVLYAASLSPAAFFAPQIAPRYLLMFQPGFMLLAALGVLGLARRWPAAGLAALAAALALQAGSLSEYYGQRRLRDQYFTLANVVNSFAQPGDVLLLHTDQEWPVVLYHLRRPLPWDGVLAGEAVQPAYAAGLAQRLTHDYQRVWLISIPDALAKDPAHLVAAELGRRLPVQFDQTFDDKRVTLFAAAPERAQAVPDANFAPQRPRRVGLLPGLTLLGYDLPITEARGGDTVSLVSYWDAEEPAQVTVALVNDAGLSAVAVPAQVAPGQQVRLQTDLRLPPGTQGRHAVMITAGEEVAILDSIQAEAVEAPDPGEVSEPTHYVLGGLIELAGYELPESVAAAGGELPLTLFWTAVEAVPLDYKVFVHLVGQEFNPTTGNPLWGQVDRQPLDGALPMTTWPPGEIITDEYSIPIDPNAPPGQYEVVVGIYDGLTGERLPLTAPEGAAGDQIVLETVAITLGE